MSRSGDRGWRAGWLLGALCLTLLPNAQVMADEPFVGEVRWVGFTFAPRNWAFCDGQLLSVAGNDALFSLLGTNYGGDGRTTFALPDLRGRAMMHEGTGPGLSSRTLGRRDGGETETLAVTHLPGHTHTAKASNSFGNSVVPNDRVVASRRRTKLYDSSADVDMHATAVAPTGGSQAHTNMQPFNTLNCIIALQGVYPSRN